MKQCLRLLKKSQSQIAFVFLRQQTLVQSLADACQQTPQVWVQEMSSPAAQL